MHVNVIRCSILAAAISAACQVHAQSTEDNGQDAAAQQTTDSSAKRTVELEKVMVTSGKIKEDLQKSSLSVTVISGDSVKGRGLSNLANMIQDTPSVQIMGTGSANQGFFIAIRGVGYAPSFGQDSPVSMNVNGVFQQRAQSVRGTFYDIDRIEVVRGPQGTLFGRNAEGGAVTVITKEPELNSFNGNATIEVGNYNLKAEQSVLNIPLSPTFALRVATSGEKRDGYLSNGDSDSDVLAGRARLLWQPSEDTKLILSAESMKTGGTGQGSSSSGYIDLTQPLEFVNGYWWSANPRGARKDFLSNNYYIDFTHKFSFGTLYLQPTYNKSDYNLERNTLNYSGYINRMAQGFTESTARAMSMTNTKEAGLQKQKSFEARLSSPDDARISWVGGLYWYDMYETTAVSEATGYALGPNGESQPSATAAYSSAYANYTGVYASSPIPVFVPELPQRTTTDYAAYGKVVFPFLEDFRWVVGARYTREDKWRNASIGNQLVNGVRINTNRYYLLDDGVANQTTSSSAYKVYFDQSERSATWDRIDYQTAIEYDLAPNSMLYGGVSTGWKSGGFLTLPDASLLAPGFKNTYDPEYLKSFEVGSKNTLLDGRLRLNASAFLYDYRDYQFSYSAAVFSTAAGADPDFVTTYLTNAARARTLGAEIEATFNLTDHDQLSMGVSYLHARFEEFDLKNANTASALLGERLKGEPLPQSPTWTLTPRYMHVFELASGATASVTLDAHFQTGSWLQAVSSTSPYGYQPRYTKYNASVGYNARDGRWGTQCYVRNITNKGTRVSTTLPTTYVDYGSISFEAEAPRTWGCSLSAYF
ncbi:MAG: TonB-dependent receptor [Pseudoxanthomonas sp.]